VSREVRVEKHKWDGRVSAVDERALTVDAEATRLAGSTGFIPSGGCGAHPGFVA